VPMSKSQIERLRRDSKELSHYIQRLKKEGDQQRAYTMTKKRDFIERQLTDMEEYS